MFARRHTPSLRERARHLIWPRKGWRRRAAFFGKRVLRLSASPYAVAMGFAVGAFFAFSPLLGLHVVFAIAVASLLRGNLIAAALGTTLCNPLTIPFMWGASFELGHLLLNGAAPAAAPPVAEGLIRHDLLRDGFAAVWPILEPMVLGSIPLGLVAALLSYALVYGGVRGFQMRRRQRLAARLAEIRG